MGQESYKITRKRLILEIEKILLENLVKAKILSCCSIVGLQNQYQKKTFYLSRL